MLSYLVPIILNGMQIWKMLQHAIWEQFPPA